MSVKKFKFVSPGIFVNEIDNSFVPKAPAGVGPVIIGRTERGPGLRPVKVSSFSEFVDVYGMPIPGGRNNDVWRHGNYVGPTYAAYAAQAYLRAGVGPVTMIRLLGDYHDNETTSAGSGKAGWKTDASHNASRASNGGAYGLFIIESGSSAVAAPPGVDAGADHSGKQMSGTLAAVWYLQEGSIELTGSDTGHLHGGDEVALSGSGILLNNEGANHEFKAIIKDADGSTVKLASFNFDDTSDIYIRKVFNTNPILTNTTVTRTAQVEKYWLGETYDNALRKVLAKGDVTATNDGASHGWITGIGSGSNHHGLQKRAMQDCETGWFISQHLDTANATSYAPEDMQKLFKLVGLSHGEWLQRNLKVSITDIKKSTRPDIDPVGSFAIEVRRIEDNDNAVQLVERFSNLSLDPTSPNYIARRIGDMYVKWSDVEKRLRSYGRYKNNSKFIRVVMNEDVDSGVTNPVLLPYGVHGPVRYGSYSFISGAAGSGVDSVWQGGGGSAGANNKGFNVFARFAGDIPGGGGSGTAVHAVADIDDLFVNVGHLAITGNIEFPAVPLRVSSSDGALTDPTNAYFGFQTTKTATSLEYDPSIPDHCRPVCSAFDTFNTSSDGLTEFSWVFSLDDLRHESNLGDVLVYESGSRARSTSVNSSSYGRCLEMGYDKFTAPFFGGSDGLDITESEPFRNTGLSSGTEYNSYAYYSIKRAIDTVADPEFVEMNLLTMPGLTENTLTDHIISTCENRGDALAIVDLDGGYVPFTENTTAPSDRRGSVADVVSNLQNRNIDSSYGCAYYPWIMINDSGTGQSVWLPPSVVALGTFASSERRSAVWFAPAGFNRGGLTEGSAGLAVTGVRERLTSKDRDKLYDSRINPIASFPSEGIVIFGQKTLQARSSALDRINVRRLMIYLKKEISRLSNKVLFDQNVTTTWNRFKSLVNPLLRGVQARFGITEYRLILDETTTTPDLVDQNIMYAKIMVKPARAIEYIAIDFTVASTGASFDD